MLLACGYQLRGLQNGNVELAINSVYLSGGGQDGVLVSLLRQRLRQLRVEQVESSDAADVSLSIGSVSQSRRVLSVNNSAKVSEFELFYSVSYTLSVTNGESKQRTASARRDITFNQNQVLAKAEEELQLYEDMRNDAANTILRVLQRVDLSPAP
ncbi:MAG: hypothetical protein GXP21_02125 [Gammaproteobacteria bacterium]|nr:hypothetical protein [Gammaproteobacteria bacterium]